MKKVILLTFLFFIFLLFTGNLSSKGINSIVTKPSFIENKGQWEHDVKFLAKTNNANIWITESGVVFDYCELGSQYPKKRQSIEMKFQNNSEKVLVKTNYPIVTKYNYFLGNQQNKWIKSVGLYEEVILENIYTGIDLKCYFDFLGSNFYFRYDFILKPEADPSQIAINFEGQTNIELKNNELEISNILGNIYHKDLYAYQKIDEEFHQVKAKFTQISNNTFGFELENYISSAELVIDPLVFSSFLGGVENDLPKDIAIDNSNNIIIVGQTESDDFPDQNGIYTELSSNDDAFVTKMNSTASTVIFSTFIGGDASDIAHAVEIDNSNNIYFAGETALRGFPTQPGAYKEDKNPADFDGFIARLSSNGQNLNYATYHGSNDTTDKIFDIALDNSNNVYCTGYTTSNNFGADGNYGGNKEIFVSKFNSTLSSKLYSRYIGGSQDEEGLSIDVVNNEAYIIGYTNSNNFDVSANAYDNSFNGSKDVFFTKLNSSGNITYSTYLGSNGNEEANSIQVYNNRAYIAGYTASNQFPNDNVVADYNNYSGGNDGFISVMNTSGNLLYSTFFGGNSGDEFTAIDIRNNFVFVGGNTGDGTTDAPTVKGAYQELHLGGTCALLAKFNLELDSLHYSSYLGPGRENLRSIKAKSNNEVLVTGYTQNTSFPSTNNAYDATHNGEQDGFVTALEMTVLYIDELSETKFCKGVETIISYKTDRNYNGNNTFTIQLSDESGNFDNPTNIGSSQSNSSGDITVLIPENIQEGIGYKIRLISSSPSDTSNVLSQTIEIFASPNPIITGENELCFEALATYTSNSTNNNEWEIISGGTQVSTTNTAQEFVVRWNQGSIGELKLSQTNSNGCKNDTTINITIFDLPEPEIIGDSLVCETRTYDYSSNNSPTMLWEVEGGIISTGTETSQNISITWDEVDSGLIRLIHTNSNDCKDTSIFIVEIFDLPEPIINGDIEVCETQDYNYTSTISPTILWEVEGGIISSGTETSQNISITWDEVDSGLIRLIQTNDNNCIDTSEVSVDIKPLPLDKQSDFHIDNVCEGEDVLIEIFNSEDNVTYGLYDSNDNLVSQEIIGNGNDITLTLESNDADENETYYVFAEQDICSKVVISNISFDINTNPVAEISGEELLCETDLKEYLSLNTADNYLWTVEGGVNGVDYQFEDSTNIQFSINWLNSGEYLINLELRNNSGCSDFDFMNIRINELPAVNINGNRNVFESSTENYSTNPENGMNFSWDCDGCANRSEVTNSNTPTISVDWGEANNNANPQVRLVKTNQNTNCFIVDTLLVNINSADAIIVNMVGDTSFCEGQTFGYTIGKQEQIEVKGGDGEYTYIWSSSDGIINREDSELTPFDVFPVDTNHYILTVKDSRGKEGSDTLTIYKIPTPNATITELDPEGYIVNTESEFSVEQPNVDYTYEWEITGNGEIIEGNGTSKIKVRWGDNPSNSTIRIVVKNEEFGCENSNEIEVDILPKSSIIINAGEDKEICIGEEIQIGVENPVIDGEGPFTYSWQPKSGLSDPDIPNPIASPNETTTYTLTVSKTNDPTITATDQVIVTVNSLPNAVIEEPFTEVYSTQTVQYKAEDCNNCTYEWTVTGGSPSSSTDNPVEITWGAEGTGIISVKVTQNTCEKESELITINIGPEPEPGPRFEPSSLSFSNTKVGLTSNSEIKLINTGDSPIEVTSITFDNQDNIFSIISITPELPFSLQPQGSGIDDELTVEIDFSPQSEGELSNRIKADFNGADPIFANISGIGFLPMIQISRDEIQFPETKIGESSTAEVFTISSFSQYSDLTISNINLIDDESGSFNIQPANLSNQLVETSGMPLEVEVIFSPQVEGDPLSARIEIISDAAAGNESKIDYINISGKGIQGDNPLLPAPTLVSPADSATGISITPSFNWNEVTNATQYDIEVATDQGYSNILINQNINTNEYQTLQNEALQKDNTYYWRVRARNAEQQSVWSASWSFETEESVPGSTTLSVSIDKLSAKPGEEVMLSVIIDEIEHGDEPIEYRFDILMSNGTILVPKEPNGEYQSKYESGAGRIRLEGEIPTNQQSGNALLELPFIATIGEDNNTSISIENVTGVSYNQNPLNFTLLQRYGDGLREVNSSFEITKIMPNPAEDKIQIEIEIYEDQENVELNIINTVGEKIKSVNLGKLRFGILQKELILDDIQTGTYHIIISSEKQTKNKILKIVK